MLLHIQPDRRPRAARARQSDNDPAAVRESDEEPLVLGDGAVQVGVGEVVGLLDGLAGTGGGADESVIRDGAGELVDDLLGAGRVHVLVVVAREVGAAVDGPEVLLDAGDAGRRAGLLLRHAGDDVQPRDDGPQPVLLPDVVAARAEALLAADAHLAGVEQAAEELPAGGHLVRSQALGFRNQVDGAGGRHAARQPVHALLPEVRDQLGMVGDDGERVARRDEGAGAVDHVPVAVTVRGGAELDAALLHRLDERVGVDEIRVRVAAAEVRFRDAVLARGGREAEVLLEDCHAVGAGDAVQAVEEDFEVRVGGEEGLDQREVEDRAQHLGVVGDGVDDLNFERAVGLGTDGVDGELGQLGDLVGGQGLGDGEDLVGDRLGGGGAVGEVVFDAEVRVWSCEGGEMRGISGLSCADCEAPPVALVLLTTWIMTGRQQDPSRCLPLPDHMACSRCRQNPMLAHDDLLHSIRSPDLGDILDRLWVPVSAITTDDQQGIPGSFGDGK